MSFVRLRWIVLAWLTASAFVLTACSGGTARLSGTPGAETKQQALGEVVGSAISDSFTVVLVDVTENPVRDVLVWRQGAEWRRWDAIKLRGGRLELGSFDVQSGVDETGILSEDEEGCTWRKHATSDQADVSCGDGGVAGITMDLFQLMAMPATSDPASQIISGRSALCYLSGSLTDGQALCVDSELHAPVAFDIGGHAYHAVSIDSLPVTLAMPIELTVKPELARLNIREADVTVPISKLELPDLPQSIFAPSTNE